MQNQPIQKQDSFIISCFPYNVNSCFKLLFLLLGLFLLHSCQPENRTKNIRSYYYPVADFMDGKVYEFKAVNDSLAPFYWYFRTTISRGDTINLSVFSATFFEM